MKRENQHDKTIEVSWSESRSEIEWRETFWEVKYQQPMQTTKGCIILLTVMKPNWLPNTAIRERSTVGKRRKYLLRPGTVETFSCKSINCMIKYTANTKAKSYFSHQTFILLIFFVFFLNDIIVFYSKDYTEESESQIIYQKIFWTRTATNTPVLNRGRALAFYIFQWKVFKFWSCLNLKSGEIEASNCKLQGVAEVSGSELLNTGSLQHTRVSWRNGSLLWLLSEFHPSEFSADGFKQSMDRLTGSHKIKPLESEKNEVVTLLHSMLYAFVEYTVILKANTPHHWLHLGIYNILYHILLTNVRAFV